MSAARLELCKAMFFAINKLAFTRPLPLFINRLFLFVANMELFYTLSQLHQLNYFSQLDFPTYEQD